ncbi:MAG: pyridoxamine 5'-phosphate oxidase family protein [Rikenellaceae bacterium]|nr:pyridoxamine 5'-phosphate oxidase family protein [Rikenellaceae bacterium]
MNNFTAACNVIKDQLGGNVVIALSTCANNVPGVRSVNGYYKDGYIYIVTHRNSHKMQDISVNNEIAFSRNYDDSLPFYTGLLSGSGEAENIGHPTDSGNKELCEELKQVFSDFYDLHVNEADKGTCILKIRLTKAIVFDGEYKYTAEYDNETADKMVCKIS